MAFRLSEMTMAYYCPTTDIGPTKSSFGCCCTLSAHFRSCAVAFSAAFAMQTNRLGQSTVLLRTMRVASWLTKRQTLVSFRHRSKATERATLLESMKMCVGSTKHRIASNAAGYPQDLCEKCVSIDGHNYSSIHYGFLDPQNAQDEECREATMDFCARGDFSDIVEYYAKYHRGHSTDPCSLTAFDGALFTSMPAWYCDYHLCYAQQHEAMLDNPSDLSITGYECDSVLIASYCIRMKQACDKLGASVGSCAFGNPSSYCEQYSDYRDCPELPAGHSLASSSTDKSPGQSLGLSLGTAVITASAVALAGGQCLLLKCATKSQ